MLVMEVVHSPTYSPNPDRAPFVESGLVLTDDRDADEEYTRVGIFCNPHDGGLTRSPLFYDNVADVEQRTLRIK